MKVSIIIPAYNAEKYIKKCIESVLDFNEIIVLDDGSTDETRIIVESYSKVNLISIKNQGVSNARNVGIENASSDYIMFVDADDYLVNGSYNMINSLKGDEDIIYFFDNRSKSSTKDELLLHITGIKKPSLAGPCCKLFKREFVLKNNIYFQKGIINGEDLLFNIKALSYAKTYKIVDKTIYMYRQVINSATKKFNEKIIESDLMFHEKFNEFLNETHFNRYEINRINIYNHLYGIITILDRASYLKEYDDFKLLVDDVLSKKEYHDYLNCNFDYLSKKQILIIILLKFKMYYLIYLLYKKKHKKIKEKEHFVNI